MNYSSLNCKKKYRARQDTIISLYQQYFSQSIPEGKQYWCMCNHQTKDGELHPTSELAQMLDQKLIAEKQFRGVDIDKEIIDLNRKTLPDILWINDDFLHAMKVAHKKGEFNPAIINADLFYMKEKGAHYISQIMAFLEEIGQEDILLIGNIVLNNPHASGGKMSMADLDSEAVVLEFEKSTAFEYAWGTGNWKLHPDFYVYNGTGKKSRTIMGTFIFVKRI